MIRFKHTPAQSRRPDPNRVGNFMVTGKRSHPLLALVRQVRAYGGQPFQGIKRLLLAAGAEYAGGSAR